MIPELMEFSKDLCSLAQFGELHFTWHFLDNTMLQSVDPCQDEHRSPFCLLMKREASKIQLRRCIHEHHEKEFRLALKERRPFIAHCHAGATELIVPIFVREEFLGILCAGTFFNPAHNGYRDSGEERRKLPCISEERLRNLGVLITAMAGKFLKKMELPSVRNPLLRQVLSHDLRIVRAVIYLRRHYAAPVQAEDVAADIHLCVSHFLHIFPKETGYTFSDFLQRLRVESARKLVEGTDIPLSEIAEVCGIRYQSRMGVLFRRYLGISPRGLRRKTAAKVSLCNGSGIRSGRCRTSS